MTVLHYKVKDGAKIKIGEAVITIRRNRDLDIGNYVQVDVEAPPWVTVSRLVDYARKKRAKQQSERRSQPAP